MTPDERRRMIAEAIIASEYESVIVGLRTKEKDILFWDGDLITLRGYAATMHEDIIDLIDRKRSQN